MNVRAFPTLKQSFRTRSEFIPSSTRKSLRNRSLCSTGKLASFKRILNLAMNYSRGRQSTLSKVVKLTCSYQQICLRLHEISKSFPVVSQLFPLLSRQISAVEQFDASLSRLVQQMFTFDFFVDFPYMHWPSKLLTTHFPFLIPKYILSIPPEGTKATETSEKLQTLAQVNHRLVGTVVGVPIPESTAQQRMLPDTIATK